MRSWPPPCVFALAEPYRLVWTASIARRHNLVTNFGKFMDPIADKILVMSRVRDAGGAETRMEAWAVVVILAREFIVSGFRLVAAAEGGVVIAAEHHRQSYKTASPDVRRAFDHACWFPRPYAMHRADRAGYVLPWFLTCAQWRGLYLRKTGNSSGDKHSGRAYQ